MPEEYTIHSLTKMHFACTDCGAKSFRRISDAFRFDDKGIQRLFKCSFCNDKKLSLDIYNLADINPELIKSYVMLKIFFFALVRFLKSVYFFD